jgi:hypothetical protein
MPTLFNADEVSMKRKYIPRSHLLQEKVGIICGCFYLFIKFSNLGSDPQSMISLKESHN